MLTQSNKYDHLCISLKNNYQQCYYYQFRTKCSKNICACINFIAVKSGQFKNYFHFSNIYLKIKVLIGVFFRRNKINCFFHILPNILLVYHNKNNFKNDSPSGHNDKIRICFYAQNTGQFCAEQLLKLLPKILLSLSSFLCCKPGIKICICLFNVTILSEFTSS